MCGVAGYINFDGSPVSFNNLKKMTDAIVHRGPDGEGHWYKNNVALGHYGLQQNSTGGQNVAAGSFALDANTTGSNNVALGYSSLTTNTTASNNTAVGMESLKLNTTGASNVAVGKDCLEGSKSTDKDWNTNQYMGVSK